MTIATVLVLLQETARMPLTSGRPMPPEQECYDVRAYDLRLRVDPGTRSIEGRVALTATLLAASPEVVLDLDDRLEVLEVVDLTGAGDAAPSGPALAFRRANGEVRVASSNVAVGSDFVLGIRYRGSPREAPRPPWDGGFVWAQTPGGAPWIATANQMQGADLWWPCKDQPSDEAERVSIRVSVPKPLVVASNGKLAGIDDDFDVAAGSPRPGWHTYHWEVSTPINTYGVALNIAPYETFTHRYTSVAGDDFDVTFWYIPEHRKNAAGLFEDILRQMRFFEGVFGPYPFRADKYGVAETPHLGMEHQTIIAYGNEFKMDRWGADRGYDELHLHEFAHEWWANLVTAENWNDFWIHEGFASYAQALYAERIGGQQAYFEEMHEQMHFANRAAVAPREKRSTAEMYFGDRAGSPGGDIYSKGCWILHSLRWLLTDEEFFPALRLMAYPDPALEKTTDGQACRFATTDELRWIVEHSSGVSLDWFFEVYLRQPELPELVSAVHDGVLELEWRAPGGRPFPMPVEVRLGGEYVRVECPEGHGRLEVGTHDWAVDPRDRVLRAHNGESR